MDPTIIGGALGAIARFAPEVLNFFDRKARRAHELALAEKAASSEHVKSALAVLQGAIQAQAQPSGVKWVDALNQAIRPIITLQWVIFLYPFSLILQWAAIFQQHGGDLTAAVAATARVFAPEEKALCSFIINFWFLGRVLDKARAA